MTDTIDLRASGLNAFLHPGNPAEIPLTWPAGSLVGRAFTSTLNGQAVTVSVATDVMTITVTAAATAALTVGDAVPWQLVETIGADDVVLLTGRWLTSDNPADAVGQAFTINLGDTTITVDVSGQAEIAAQAARAALESLGAQVDQATARTLEARWLQFIRDAGSAAPPHATWHYLGGDVTDAVHVPATSDVFWIFADGFDAGPSAVNASTDLYTTTPLPQRSGAIVEDTPGTFTGATQLFVSGTSGLWLNADTQGGFAGHHWWPIGLIDDNGTYRVACWRVLDGDSPHGDLVETDIVTLVFGGYQSHTVTGLGALTDDFWVSGMWRDTTHTYIYAMEFVPPFDDRTAAAPAAPNYVLDNPREHYSLTRIARVVNGSLLTIASWEFWNGSTWVAGVTNATPLADVDGNQIRGDAGIRKITDTHYLLVAHALMDSHLDVYKAAAPQGPWTQISRVPLPTQGHSVNGSNTFEVGQLCKILPPQVQTPPAEHSIALISRNTIVPTVGYSAEEPFTSRNIRRYAPQFAVIPHH